jgi:cyclic pyranopterin phosphate synthase
LLYTCLFATHGMDLRTRVRAGASDAELLELIDSVWNARTDRYSETRDGLRAEAGGEQKVEMFYIGG